MLVTSPRGTLSAWALNHSRRKKQLLRPLQWRALLRADLLHATSETEYFQIRDAGCRAPVAVIPNGIDMPAFPAVGARQEHRTLLYLGRIHPIKGIDRLLHAWRAIAAEHPDWVLEIAGGGEPQHVAEVRHLSEILKLQRVAFLGPVYGAEKSAAYCRAELFVLPTHSENFGMAVAEALAHGCPAIVATGASWEGLDREVCGWWVSNEVDELAAALGSAMGLPSDRLAVMGRNGRAWMARDYGWESIAERMTASYRYVTHGADEPACVRRH
jgi:glycosyltransferase involved in cell wall biosynthesis